MTGYIDTPTIGEILQEEFMEPMDISAYKLAQEIHVPVSRIQDILHDRRKITADTSLRLAKYFGVSVDYLLGAEEKMPALTSKDERDISKKLEEALSQLESSQEGLMFQGEPLDDATKELIAISLRNSLEMGKKLAKQKFTPKKYKGEQ